MLFRWLIGLSKALSGLIINRYECFSLPFETELEVGKRSAGEYHVEATFDVRNMAGDTVDHGVGASDEGLC